MYWYTNKKYSLIAVASILATAMFACTSPQQEQQAKQEQPAYFDIPAFIQTEIDSLKVKNPTVEKTVTKDKESETKSLAIKNWDNELSSFKAIDLNKPAYHGFIEVDTVDQVLQYAFTNPELDLSCVRISLDPQGQVKMISVEKHVKNTLYQTNEFLVYEKGNFYIVEKTQQVKAMGENYYKVQGNLK